MTDAMALLERVALLSRRLDDAGLRFSGLDEAARKVGEELGEVMDATSRHRDEELGDLLFAVLRLFGACSGYRYPEDWVAVLERTAAKITARLDRLEELRIVHPDVSPRDLWELVKQPTEPTATEPRRELDCANGGDVRSVAEFTARLDALEERVLVIEAAEGALWREIASSRKSSRMERLRALETPQKR